MPSSVITRKGQVTIPKQVRDNFAWREGDRVVFVERDGEVVLKVLRGSILDVAGSVTPKNRPEDFAAVRSDVRKARARRMAESS